MVIEMCLLCWIVWLERFCFLDKEDARIEIVPMEEYNASELSEVGITEKTLYHLIGKVCRSPCVRVSSPTWLRKPVWQIDF